MTISIQTAIQEGSDALREAGIDDPRREAGSLLANVLNRDQTFLLAQWDDSLTREQVQSFRSSIARRLSGEPQQYITGFQEFYKLKFEVTPEVLIPRPETEAIVEIALALLNNEATPLIADIGTGSGCIAISFLKERALLESDLFVNLSPSEPFSLIASNPPYIPESDWATLPREVRDHEPRAALVAGADGLDSIRRLLEHAPTFLRAHGFLIFEIGFGQAEAVCNLIASRVWNLLEMRRDLQGIPRTVVLQKN